MTRFAKNDFTYHGGYLTYGTDRKFVARFKHSGPYTKAKFLKELIKNHSVESYFAALEAGKAPLQILRDANEIWFVDTMNNYYGRKVI